MNQALSPTEIAILSAASELRSSKGRPPTASEIRSALSRRLGLKKTQLYDLLRRLTQFGFITVKTLPRPRRYIVNQVTLMSGITNWIEAQKRSVLGMNEEIDVLGRALQKPKTRIRDWFPVEGSARE